MGLENDVNSMDMAETSPPGAGSAGAGSGLSVVSRSAGSAVRADVAVDRSVSVARPGLLAQMAARYAIAPEVFEATVRAVAMPNPHRREELISCLVVANEHNLNPLTKEIYFMRTKSGTIQPIVGVDGWLKKLNDHPHFDGMEFEDTVTDSGTVSAVTCTVYRKDRSRPTKVTEYLRECAGESPAWKKTPARMLRHRALTQAARYAVGFAGAMDHDEFVQWEAIAQPVKSSAKAKRDGDFDTVRRLIAECQSCGDLDALLASSLWCELPERWKDLLTGEAVEPRRAELMDTIADPEAVIAKLAADIAEATSAGDIAEIAEANSALIERLPEDYKGRAYKMLDGQ